jgi:Ca2+-transporting ATPase
MVAVALAVGAIPEGLPAAMTIMLAVGVSRMAERRAIVRKLPAVEALGSTTIVCSDKTGTLTENQMTVQAIVAGGERYEVEGAGYAPRGAIRRDEREIEPQRERALLECLRAGLLCNDARLHLSEGRPAIDGDPTEGALVVAAAKAGLDSDAEHAALPRVDVVPFDSDAQFMATLHRPAVGEDLVFAKGSVERILAMCSTAQDARGESSALDEVRIHAEADRLARAGLRVLAFATATRARDAGPLSAAELIEGASMRFLGLQGMLDPPRPEAIRAVASCRRAGVAVTMITGDHAGTAQAIAERIGLGPGLRGGHATVAAPLAVVTGRELASVSDAALPELAERTHVFARMTPEQKLRLVRALQTRGHVVAMTGDGVNDAPALRQADIGVAMGLAGTEVAKEAADIILADDNFASIEAAIEEGRAVFDNLTKFLVWIMPTNVGVALIIVAAMALGTPLPILPVQALYINLMTAVLLGLTLVFEPKERDLMDRPPRDPSMPIITYELVMRTGFTSLLLLVAGFGLFEWASWRGVGEAEARTLVVCLIVFGETCYLFNCRSLVRSVRSVGWFTNPILWGGVATMTLVQIAFVHLEPLNRLFQSAPLDAAAWIAVIAASLAIGLAVGIEKAIRRRFA